jgi:hypothetical protein
MRFDSIRSQVAAGVHFVVSAVKASAIEEVAAPSSHVQRPFEERNVLNQRRWGSGGVR